MIDNSDPGAWERALRPDHRSIQYLSDTDLRGPFILEQVQRWHGLATLAEARDMVGAELRRRTQTNDYGRKG